MKKIICNCAFIIALCLLLCFVTSCGKTYTITYMDGDNVLKTESVKKGQNAIGFIPEKEGHTFDGWSLSIENVTEDITVFANFVINTYTIKFYVNGELYDTKTCQYKRNNFETKNRKNSVLDKNYPI